MKILLITLISIIIISSFLAFLFPEDSFFIFLITAITMAIIGICSIFSIGTKEVKE